MKTFINERKCSHANKKGLEGKRTETEPKSHLPEISLNVINMKAALAKVAVDPCSECLE